jgi:hypothetical protein
VRPAFALDESTGDFSGGVGLVAVLDEKGEEIEWAFLVTYRDCGEDHRVAELYQSRPCCLFCHAARLDDELPAREFAFNALHLLLAFSCS